LAAIAIWDVCTAVIGTWRSCSICRCAGVGSVRSPPVPPLKLTCELLMTVTLLT
jgi:hypothetical protein